MKKILTPEEQADRNGKIILGWMTVIELIAGFGIGYMIKNEAEKKMLAYQRDLEIELAKKQATIEAQEAIIEAQKETLEATSECWFSFKEAFCDDSDSENEEDIDTNTNTNTKTKTQEK